MYDAARHVPLVADPWDESAAGASIAEIAGDALARFDPHAFWPAHPLDEGLSDGATQLYFGATGVIWALDHLARAGAGTRAFDFTPVLPRLLEASGAQHRRHPYPRHASYLMGEVGALLLWLKLAPEAAIADALAARITDNDGLPVMELMWGTPGTMLACVFAAAMTGEARWRGLWRGQAARLLADLGETRAGALWTQRLYGHVARYLGLVHGYAGNMGALLRGWDWLDAASRARIADAAPRALAALAWESDEGANWPAVAGEDQPPYLVQVCHGAPGIVVGLAGGPLADPDLDRLLRRAGDLIVRTGPLAKGPNLCHGTAGNGYALLKLHARGGDPARLAQARAFAMTAIAQCRDARRRYGRGRYSLWTGDLGLAVFLWDCIRGEAAFPTLDVF
jgi:hypothetical protein